MAQFSFHNGRSLSLCSRKTTPPRLAGATPPLCCRFTQSYSSSGPCYMWSVKFKCYMISPDLLLNAGKHGNKIQLDSRTRLFLYQIVGTWGQLLFPKPWKEFRLWYDIHKAKGIKPYLDGMVMSFKFCSYFVDFSLSWFLCY